MTPRRPLRETSADPEVSPEVAKPSPAALTMYHPSTGQTTTVESVNALRAWETRGWVPGLPPDPADNQESEDQA